MSKYDFDLAIIGSGPAGRAAAEAGVQRKKKVVIIEKNLWGGAEVNTRDIPYSAGLNFSHLYAKASFGTRLGISAQNLRFNYPTVYHWQRNAILKTRAEIKKHLEELGVTCIHGQAHFVGTHELSLSDNSKITAKNILIATGAKLKNNGITGMDTVPHYTPDTVLGIDRIPNTVMVVGGGASGCEIAQYFAELGSKVAISEISDRLLPREDAEVGDTLAQYFDKRFDIKVLTKTRVVAIEEDDISEKVFFVRDGQEKLVRVEAIVIATGSESDLDLGLENARIKLSKTGIKLRRTLQTSEKHIFAAGDAVEAGCSSEQAAYEGALAVMNMYTRSTGYANTSGFVRMVETAPQIAVVGLTEDDLVKRSIKYKKVIVPTSDSKVALTHDENVGFVKILVDKEGFILGSTIMLPNAAEVIQELSLAVRHHLPLLEIASTPHIKTSWSDLVLIAAKKLARGRA